MRDYKYHPNAGIVHQAVQDKKTTPEYFEKVLKELSLDDRYCLHENHISLHSLLCHGNYCSKNVILFDMYNLDIDMYGAYVYLKFTDPNTLNSVLDNTKRLPIVIGSVIKDYKLEDIKTSILETLLNHNNIKGIEVNSTLKSEIEDRRYAEEVKTYNYYHNHVNNYTDSERHSLAVWAQKTFGGLPID